MKEVQKISATKAIIEELRNGGALWINRDTDMCFYGDYCRIGHDDLNNLLENGLVEKKVSGRLSDFYKLTELGKTIKLIP